MEDLAVDDGVQRRGRLGDLTKPFAWEVVRSDGGPPLALTEIEPPPAPAAAEDVVSRLEKIRSPHLLTADGSGRTTAGTLYVVGPIPVGQPLSLVARPMEMGVVAAIGSQLLTAVEDLHPDPAEVDLLRTTGRSQEAPGLVHNDICPEHVLWDAESEGVTLVGLARATPAVARRPQLIPEESRFLPPDHVELGHHPSADLWAVAQILGDLLSEGGAGPEPNDGPPLEAFFARALAREHRRRFQDAASMRAAWDEAIETTRLRRDPLSWAELTQAIADAAHTAGVTTGPDDDPAELAHRLIPRGMAPSVAEDIAMLAEVRHDLRGDRVRFDEFARTCMEEISRIGGGRDQR